MVKEKTKDLPAEVTESVSKIWLAGLGALAVAEEEGSKLFRSLVKKGEAYEAKGKANLDKVMESVTAVGGRAGKAWDGVSGRAEKAWDGVSGRLDEQVAAVLARIGVPTKDEIATLTSRVEELTRLVEKVKQPAAKPKTTSRG